MNIPVSSRRLSNAIRCAIAGSRPAGAVHYGLLSVVFAGLALPGSQALAQGASALDEIVVTARKRDESLLDVPVALTAFSAADIEQSGMVSLEDIAALSPGLSFAKQGDTRGGRSESVVRFRGMSINDISPVRQLASVFLDGVYVSAGLAAISLEEVERVEVIKGPQSAYFGRSTFGGAVNFVTRDPSFTDFSGQFNLRAAEDSEYDVSLSLDIPLVEGAWAARVGARYYSTDGRYTSTADGGALGAEETKSLSLTLVGAPNDNVDLRFRAFYAEDDDGLPPTFALGTELHNCGPFFEGGRTYFCGTLPVLTSVGLNTILDGQARDAFVNNTFNSQAVAASPLTLDSLGMRRKMTRLSLAGDWQVGDTPYLVSFNTGYNWTEQYRMTDTDHTGRQVWVEANFQDIEDKAFEVRLSRDHDRVSWMLGASYFNLEYTAPTGATVGFLYPNDFAPNGFFFDQTVSTSTVKTRGLFGSVSYALTDTVNLSIEGRYQSEKIEEIAPAVALGETFTNFLPRAILQWQPSAETNVYLSLARGNMPGNFNGNVVQFNEQQQQQILEQTGATGFVDEAELDSIELGWKQSLLDGRAYFAAAAYFMKWKNQQNRSVAVVDDPTSPAGFRTVPVVLGDAVTELWGLELEGNFLVTENWSLAATFNWAASEIQRFACDLCIRVIGTDDVSGNSLARFPEYSGTLSATYTAEINADWSWFARGDALYNGKTYPEVLNLAQTPAYWVTNLRAGVESDNWRVEAFVTNLFDDKHYRSGARNADFTTGNFNITNFVINVTPAEPRQFGVRLRYRF